MANQTNQKDQEIKNTEHSVGKILIAHTPPTPAATAPVIPLNAQPSTRPGLQNLRAMPMVAPPDNNANLFSLNQNLQLNLLAWKPTAPAQQTLKKDLNAQLTALNDILFQQTLAETVEEEEKKSQFTIDPSDPMAPSLEKLREDLASIAALEPTLPPALAAAVEKFNEEYIECFGNDAPMHPLPKKAHDNKLDSVPQPEE